MLRGMTGFGKGVVKTALGRFIAQIGSVNRRHLEVRVLLPSGMQQFETDIKNWIGKEITRGAINVSIHAEFSDASPVQLSANLPFLRQLKKTSQEMAQELHLDSQFCFELLAKGSDRHLLFSEEESVDAETYRQALHDALQQALKPLLAMKKEEGKALQQDIESRLTLINNAVDRIILCSAEASVKYQERLKERLNEALEGSVEENDKLLQAVVAYAEKLDISEELTRLQHHLKQFRVHLKSDEFAMGKSLEFLLQELARETNTLSAKSSDIAIIQHALTIKSELEKVREQIQNIE